MELLTCALIFCVIVSSLMVVDMMTEMERPLLVFVLAICGCRTP
jgi:hypothetical protein